MRLTQLFSGEAKQSAEGKRSVEYSGRSQPTPAQAQMLGRQIRSLVPGQTISGEIVGRNGSEVQIKLSEDMVLNARVDRSLNIEIGKNMTFEVKNNGSSLTLSPLFTNVSTDVNVLKALDMAGLPVNGRSVGMTGQLMAAGLSVGRNFLLQVFREINSFPQGDISDIVNLHRLQMPVNEANVNQMASYRNLTHQLTEGMDTILGALPEVLDSMGQAGAGGDIPGAVRLYQELLALVREGADGQGGPAEDGAVLGAVPESGVGPGGAAGQEGGALAGGVLVEDGVLADGLAGEGAIPTDGAGTAGGIVAQGAANSLFREGMAPDGATAEAGDSAGGVPSAGAVSASGIASEAGVLANGITAQGAIGALASESVLAGGESSGEAAAGGKGSGTIADGAPSQGAGLRGGAGAEELLGGPRQSARNPGAAQTPDISPAMREAAAREAAAALDGMELSPEAASAMRARIMQFAQGQTDAQQFFAALSQLADMGKNSPQSLRALEKMFSSRAVRGLLSGQIKNLWTVSPRELAEPGKVEELYRRMDRQLKNLAQALESAGQTGSAAFKAASSMSQNLDFMQQLNQMYAYVQLPLRLQQREAHGELYVYSNKKKLTSRDGQISALLHLDMEHLGPVDVYVAMQNSKVSTRFYLRDDEMIDFISGHMDLLTERLAKRGYDCSFAMTVRGTSGEATEGGLEPLLRQEKGIALSQYAFDVRT